MLALLPPVAGAENNGFDPGRLGYAVEFNGKRSDWHTFAYFVLPGESVDLRLLRLGDAPVVIEPAAGRLSERGEQRWRWRAPETLGLHPIRIEPEGHPAMTLNVVVMRPGDRTDNGSINGYRVGEYPDRPLGDNPIYLPPAGKIEVTRALMDLPVSPNFTLGQFVGKQQPDHWPKYMLLREELVAKLEIILDEVNRRGIRTDTFFIMSGHRTPWYNHVIGNGRYSRHVWGGAADIFIDTTGDGRMDDLNGDGRVDLADAELLHQIIEDLYSSGRFRRLTGGLGLYGPRPHRGPFVHVDARGHQARWAIP